MGQDGYICTACSNLHSSVQSVEDSATTAPGKVLADPAEGMIKPGEKELWNLSPHMKGAVHAPKHSSVLSVQKHIWILTPAFQMWLKEHQQNSQ